MLPFNDWCDVLVRPINGHELAILAARPVHAQLAKEGIAEEIPTHYCSEEHIARNLERLGRPAAAALIREKLPTRKSVRSGDLGEILAAAYIAERTNYVVPIWRLRWKDHRNMSMRGEDVIAIQRVQETGRLRFLKCEAKSRVTLSAGVVTAARANLDNHQGLPSPHALGFISARLIELGDAALADAIDDEQLRHGIVPANVRHLLFTFSGNDPSELLEDHLANHAGDVAQGAAGIWIATHAAFVGETYEIVMANG